MVVIALNIEANIFCLCHYLAIRAAEASVFPRATHIQWIEASATLAGHEFLVEVEQRILRVDHVKPRRWKDYIKDSVFSTLSFGLGEGPSPLKFTVTTWPTTFA